MTKDKFVFDPSVYEKMRGRNAPAKSIKTLDIRERIDTIEDGQILGLRAVRYNGVAWVVTKVVTAGKKRTVYFNLVGITDAPHMWPYNVKTCTYPQEPHTFVFRKILTPLAGIEMSTSDIRELANMMAVYSKPVRIDHPAWAGYLTTQQRRRSARENIVRYMRLYMLAAKLDQAAKRPLTPDDTWHICGRTELNSMLRIENNTGVIPGWEDETDDMFSAFSSHIFNSFDEQFAERHKWFL
jgi:hypothetical protein